MKFQIAAKTSKDKIPLRRNRGLFQYRAVMEAVQLLISCCSETHCLEVSPDCSTTEFQELVSFEFGLPVQSFILSSRCGTKRLSYTKSDKIGKYVDYDGEEFMIVHEIHGGIDFQHREGSKIGSGGMLSESQAAFERKERLRKLALETIDITKDPYFFKNHLGTFECRLCFTLHPNEGNYLAHTQAKRHQSNLGRRAAMEAQTAAPKAVVAKEIVKKRVIKIGRPGYKV